MGYAAQHPGGQLGLGVSASVASAVLYGAVVMFGLGSASPSTQGRPTDRSSPVVRVAPDRAVSRPGKRLPQVSPGPARQPSRARVHRGSEQVTTVVATAIAAGESEKGSTPRPQPKSQGAITATSEVQSASPTSSTPGEPDPIVTVPDLPVTVPDVPLTVPTLPLPLPLPPTPSVQVPATPTVPLP